MKITINTWILRNKNIDGIGYFTINTVSNLIKNHPEVEFEILCDKSFYENYFDFPNVKIYKIFPALRHPILYVFYMEIVVGLFLRKHNPDLFISTDGYLSLCSNTKQLPIIHDINFEHYPQDVAFKNRVYFRTFFKKFAKKGVRVATVSEYSKQDISNYYKIKNEKIDNISSGIDSKFMPLNYAKKIIVKKKWTKGCEYFFFIGSMHPRKNIKRLILAFELFKIQTNSNYKLVLVGLMQWQTSDIKNIYLKSKFKEDIIFTGRLIDSDVQLLFGAAFALCFAPIFEGFGLPIVEAFQCGVPVICSNITSMPEIAGDAAILFNPYDINEIANAMKKIYLDPTLSNQLIKNGYNRKLQFSWMNTSKLLWQSIQKCINEK